LATFVTLAALEMITMALRDVRNDSDAAFVAVDGRGAVNVYEVTHYSIARLWQDLVFGQTQRDGPAEARRFRPSVPVQTAE
jgi:hypothetical protein